MKAARAGVAVRAQGRERRRGESDFVRGFVASACLSAFQDSAGELAAGPFRRVLRHGLQGGAALTAGTRVAVDLRRGDYTGALVAAAAGAAGVLLIEKLLGDAVGPATEDRNG